MEYEIKELVYRSGRVYFYAIDKKTNEFCFGISKTKTKIPELTISEDSCYSKEGYVLTFKRKCYYEINITQSDKKDVKMYTFNKVEPQEERNFFNQLISIVEQS